MIPKVSLFERGKELERGLEAPSLNSLSIQGRGKGSSLRRGAPAPLKIFPPSFGKGRGSGGWISHRDQRGEYLFPTKYKQNPKKVVFTPVSY
jgi:hypothetical protein